MFSRRRWDVAWECCCKNTSYPIIKCGKTSGYLLGGNRWRNAATGEDFLTLPHGSGTLQSHLKGVSHMLIYVSAVTRTCSPWFKYDWFHSCSCCQKIDPGIWAQAFTLPCEILINPIQFHKRVQSTELCTPCLRAQDLWALLCVTDVAVATTIHCHF